MKNNITESDIIAFFKERISEINTATKQDYCIVRLAINQAGPDYEIEWSSYTPNGSWTKKTESSADTVALQVGGSSADCVAARKRKEAQALLDEAKAIGESAK